MAFDIEKAGDVQELANDLVNVLGQPHLVAGRILCVRSKGSKANAYARIWSMPKVWKVALDIKAFYIIEVLSENYDHLDYEEKVKVILHELMHIPKTFSGALLPHKHRGGRINNQTVDKIYNLYKQRVEKYSML